MISNTTVQFDQLALHPTILRAVAAAGYQQATPVQTQAIPLILDGHDLLASAQTGTGKTAAFTLPALNLLATPHPIKSRGPRILVLTPTRELAAQVNDAARKYGKFIKARTVSIVGGMPYPLQNKLLSQPLDILVATPGRLLDHMERGRIDMSRLQMLILDEADRMLDMGFMPDVERICAALPTERQTLLFSATLDSNIKRIANEILRQPQTIEVTPQTQKHENIEQRLHLVDDMHHKNRLLEHLLISPDVNQAIVFTSTKRHADTLAEDLYAAGHKTAALHGDMTQGARNRTLSKLRHGDVKVLVATDVAARGIDVHGITHVINYDLPKFAEDYVHRIGRTGRAGNTGVAVSFAVGSERHQIRKIEQYTGQRLEFSVVAGLEPKKAPAQGRNEGRGRKDGRGRNETRHGKPSKSNYTAKTQQRGAFNQDKQRFAEPVYGYHSLSSHEWGQAPTGGERTSRANKSRGNEPRYGEHRSADANKQVRHTNERAPYGDKAATSKARSNKSTGDKFAGNKTIRVAKGDSRFANRDKARQARRSFI